MSCFGGPEIVGGGLVFYFDADNAKSYPGSGTALYDLTGNSTTGEAVNTPTFNSAGYFTFNGSTNYLRFTNSTALDSQTISVSVWVNTNNLTQTGFWFEKGTVNTQYSIFQEGASIKCRVNTGSLVDTINIATASYMTTGNWYNVVFTFTSGSQVCYINGAVVGTGTTTGTLATNSGGMSIGAYGGYSGGRGYYYNGSQSIAKVYNRVLTQAEVLQNFNALRGRYGV